MLRQHDPTSNVGQGAGKNAVVPERIENCTNRDGFSQNDSDTPFHLTRRINLIISQKKRMEYDDYAFRVLLNRRKRITLK